VNQNMSDTGMEQKTRDHWEKFEILSKGIAAILVTGGLSYYGIQNTTHLSETAEANRKALSESADANRKALSESAEANRKAQVFIETLNHRETAMSDMRSKMFDTLMQSYFRDESFFGAGKEIESRVAILETMGLNFHDVLHLKPLFVGLDSEINELIKVNGASRELNDRLNQQKTALRKAANRIKTAELLKIGDASGSFMQFDVHTSKSINLIDQGLPIVIHVREIMGDGIRLLILDSPDETPTDDEKGFTVSFFDMPLQDNSRIGELTYSITLENVELENQEAKITVVVLPRSYTYRNSLLFDEMLVDYMEKKEMRLGK